MKKNKKNTLNFWWQVGRAIMKIGNSHSTHSHSIWSIFIRLFQHESLPFLIICLRLMYLITIKTPLPFLRCHQSPATGNWSTSKSFQRDSAQNAFSEIYLVLPLRIFICGWQDLSHHSYIIHDSVQFFFSCTIASLCHQVITTWSVI